MNHHYNDIRDRIKEPPLWFDEHAVPRYVPFSPDECADIYADEAVLLLIECQDCGKPFQVCMSDSAVARLLVGESERVGLEEAIKTRAIHYGDPPNTGCCLAGPTMNSVPKRVLECWVRHRGEVGEKNGIKNVVLNPVEYMKWNRLSELEINVTPDWVNS